MTRDTNSVGGAPGVELEARCRNEDCPSVGQIVLVGDDAYSCADCGDPLAVAEDCGTSGGLAVA